MRRKWKGVETPVEASTLIGGADGSVWFIGADKRARKWLGDRWAPPIEQAWFSLGASPSGRIWTVGMDHRVFDWRNGAPLPVAGHLAYQLSVGGDESVWYVGMNNRVFQLVGDNAWNECQNTSDVSHVAVHRSGVPWHMGKNSGIWFLKPDGSWKDTAAGASSLSTCFDGTVLHTSNGEGGGIYAWTGVDWTVWDDEPAPMLTNQVLIAGDGTVWRRNNASLGVAVG